MKNSASLLISELLIKKFGQDKIAGLLTAEYSIEKNRGDSPLGGSYTRRMKNSDPLVDYFCNPKLQKLPPRLLLEALDDAAEEMNFSNWHADKFERIAEIIIRYCEMKEIPIDITIKVENDDE